MVVLGLGFGWIALDLLKKIEAWQGQVAIFLGLAGLVIGLAVFTGPGALGAFAIGVGVAIFMWGMPKKGKMEGRRGKEIEIIAQQIHFPLKSNRRIRLGAPIFVCQSRDQSTHRCAQQGNQQFNRIFHIRDIHHLGWAVNITGGNREAAGSNPGTCDLNGAGVGGASFQDLALERDLCFLRSTHHPVDDARISQHTTILNLDRGTFPEDDLHTGTPGRVTSGGHIHRQAEVGVHTKGGSGGTTQTHLLLGGKDEK